MLVFSLILMGSATVVIGVIAPIPLVIARLAKGFAVGGEWAVAALMAEHAPERKRAFYGGFPPAGVPVGLVFPTLAFLLVERLPDEEIMRWGWRVPFLSSAGLVAVGMVFRQEKHALVVGILTKATSLAPFLPGDRLRSVVRPEGARLAPTNNPPQPSWRLHTPTSSPCIRIGDRRQNRRAQDADLRIHVHGRGRLSVLLATADRQRFPCGGSVHRRVARLSVRWSPVQRAGALHRGGFVIIN